MEQLGRKKAAALVLGGMLAFYLLCTPVGAVRLAIAAAGHPVSAVSCQMEDGFVHSSPAGRVRPYHVTQPPVDRLTAGELENWGVYRFGPFCVAKHWGYC